MARSRSTEAEGALVERARSGEARAIEELVRSHLWLVPRVLRRLGRHGDPRSEDLEQEGRLGLVLAARHFRGTGSLRFAAYAAGWIRSRILQDVLHRERPLTSGLGRAGRTLFWGLAREEAYLRARGIEPTDALLAERLGTAVEDVSTMRAYLSITLVGTEAGLDDDGAGCVLPEPSELPEEHLLHSEERAARRELLRAFAERLPDRERVVWTRRFESDPPATRDEVASRLGLTRERVRQLEGRLLHRLAAEVSARRGRARFRATSPRVRPILEGPGVFLSRSTPSP